MWSIRGKTILVISLRKYRIKNYPRIQNWLPSNGVAPASLDHATSVVSIIIVVVVVIIISSFLICNL